MARSGDDLISCKRDAKLENFLKQKLGDHVFERIRAYEACIAQSRKVKRGYKFVVLSDEKIYITDNPPKVIRAEESVHLGDVTSINLVNEFPEFLSGEVRDNSQHICVKYKAIVPVTRSRLNLLNRRAGKTDKKTGSDEDRVKSNSSSSNSSPILRLTSPKGETGDVSDEGNRRASLNGKAVSLRLNRSLDESDLCFLRSQSSLLGSDDEEQHDRLSLSLPTSALKKLRVGSSSQESSSVDDDEDLEALNNNKVKKVDTCRPLPKRPPGNPGDTIQNIDIPDTLTTNFATTLATPDQTSSRKSSLTSHRSLPSPDAGERKKSEPFQFPSSKPERPEPTRRSNSIDQGRNGTERQKMFKSKSLDSSSSKSDSSSVGDEGEQEERMEEVEEELHLYLLTISSPFLMRVRSSWNNFIVRSTLLKDPKVASRMGTGKSSSKQRLPSREVLERQFQQLKSEITNSANSMPDVFQLVQELCNAAEKYFVLKKLFWKTEDLFEFMIAQLNRYLPKSELNLQNNERGRHHRADELELAILLIESLGLMFRETEMAPGRLSTVKANNGKAVLDLVVVLTCLPEVPQRWRPPRTKAHSLLLETDADSWETYGDAEVFNLVKELTDASIAVLFELILIAHQSNWGNSEGRFFNICWLIKVLESLQTTTYKFVERLISRAMRFLMPSSTETLTPVQAVLLFQQFFVLQTLIQYSSPIAAHVRSNYTEEFRYYVRSPHIVNKLPTDYPITKITLRLISEVLSHVLQERTTLQAAK
ncbi:uncharacterized protein C12orf56 homolog [Asterias rubens]|uniref:uncharacterized protein C12orf56 homolog n=1 Tax=Asterias rubens TaxID=7604 RepID=UPI001455CE37|nr:uncharacterized protein C12orf56 homolog [Asterias rubens]